MTITTEERHEPEHAKNIELPPSYSPDEAVIAAAKLQKNPNRKPLSQYFGIISKDTFGDGVVYQRKLRDEWDD